MALSASLLSIPTLVEAPYIIFKVGDYTFGTIDKKKLGSTLRVTYPDFILSVLVTKVNGELNTYLLRLQYAITPGRDPNLVDRVFSTVAESRKGIISYGDYASPSFIYREEEVLITNVKSTISFSLARIDYTVSCVSVALGLKGNVFNFPATTEQPSKVIRNLLSNQTYGLTDVFSGMKNNKELSSLLASDDTPVHLESKPLTNVIDYLNYVVSCMKPADGTGYYRMLIIDDNKNKYKGSYFLVQKITTRVSTATADTLNGTSSYTIDVGYPSNNFVTDFLLKDNELWSILYLQSLTLPDLSTYLYKIDSFGRVLTNKSLPVTRSRTMLEMEPDDESWWTKMTSFPIGATLTLKGLVRPTILMSYIKINVVFYGMPHIASGTYYITKQTDTVDSNGYKTVLELLRIPDTSSKETAARLNSEYHTGNGQHISSTGNVHGGRSGSFAVAGGPNH